MITFERIRTVCQYYTLETDCGATQPATHCWPEQCALHSVDAFDSNNNNLFQQQQTDERRRREAEGGMQLSNKRPPI